MVSGETPAIGQVNGHAILPRNWTVVCPPCNNVTSRDPSPSILLFRLFLEQMSDTQNSSVEPTLPSPNHSSELRSLSVATDEQKSQAAKLKVVANKAFTGTQ